MSHDNNPTDDALDCLNKTTLLEQVTPLARQINCLDINRVAEVCVREMPVMVGTRFASLYVLDEANSILHLIGHNHPFPINRIVSLSQSPPSPMVMAIKSKELILTGNIDTHTKPVIRRSQRAFAENYETTNCAIVPLICQERVVGVLNLADKTDPCAFTREDISLIELFGQLIGASIGNIRLFEKVQRQATCDGLTGLMNHKTFYDVLEKEVWRARRYGGTISLIMADIDNLKMLLAPFLPFSSQKLHHLLGYDGQLCGRQYTETIPEETRSHLVLRFEGTASTGRWSASQLAPGQVLRQPSPLFKKLDDSIVDEELARLAGGR